MTTKLKSYRPKQAAEFLGIGVSTFWRWVQERNDFPQLIRLSARCTVVDGDQLVAWRDAQFNNPLIPKPTTQPDKTKKSHKDEMKKRICEALKAEVIRERKMIEKNSQ